MDPTCAPRTEEQKVLDRQRRVTYFPYYSRILVQLVRSGAGPFAYDLAIGTELRAFGYGLNKDATIAGFAAGFLASDAETNLQEANRTLAGQTVSIEGIACGITPDSNPQIVEEFWSKSSVRLELNGGETGRYLLGPCAFLPAGCGLTGGPSVDLLDGNSLDGVAMTKSYIANGLPGIDNVFRFPDPIVWRKAGADSSMNIVFALRRAISLASATVAPAAGVKGFTAPAALAKGTFAKIDVKLVGRVMGKRTRVA